MHVVCSNICFDNTITGNCKRREFVLGEFNYEKLVLILAHENDYLFDNTASEASEVSFNGSIVLENIEEMKAL